MGAVLNRAAGSWSILELNLDRVGSAHAVAVGARHVVAMGGASGHVALYDVFGDGKPVSVIDAQESKVNVVAFSSIESTLAVAGADATLELYDVTNPEEPVRVKTLTRDSTSEVTALVFDTVGGRLVSGDDRGTITLWNPRSPIGRICELVTRNPTIIEWRDYVDSGDTSGDGNGFAYERTCSDYPSGAGAHSNAPIAF